MYKLFYNKHSSSIKFKRNILILSLVCTSIPECHKTFLVEFVYKLSLYLIVVIFVFKNINLSSNLMNLY